MSFNVTYSFNNGATTGTATDYMTLYNAIHNYSNLTQCTLSGTAEGALGWHGDFDGLFDMCRRLTSLDLSNLDTSNVTDMNFMFYYCDRLTSLDLSNLDTSNVTNMSGMFFNCSSLTSIDLSSFDTSNVTNLGQMFMGCSSLTSLDVSKFNTSNVTWMNGMFESCRALTSLDLSSFDTSNVTNMAIMFENCLALTSLDLSNFDISNLQNCNDMFYLSSNLEHIYVGDGWNNFNYNDVETEEMFLECTSLPNYDSSNVDGSMAKLISEGGYFEELKYLIQLKHNGCKAYPKVAVDGTTIVQNNGILSATAQTPSIATTTVPGIVKPDGTTITVTSDGTISATGGVKVVVKGVI